MTTLDIMVTDAEGEELGRAAVEIEAERWNVLLHRAGVPRFITRGERRIIALDGCGPMRAGEVIQLVVRVPVESQYAATLLWLVATRAAWGLS